VQRTRYLQLSVDWGMRIRELEEGGEGGAGPVGEQEEGEEVGARIGGEVARLKAKQALVGAGARVLFYPTLLYNVLRNRFEADFRWWDRVDQVVVSIRLLFCAVVWINCVAGAGSASVYLRALGRLLTNSCEMCTLWRWNLSCSDSWLFFHLFFCNTLICFHIWFSGKL
jgi:hypothetical protein